TYGSPDGNDINQGLSGNETITINLLNGLSDFVKIKLTTAPAIDYNNLAANVIMKAYDLNGTLVGNVSSTFTGVTNGSYTPEEIGIKLSKPEISRVTLH